MSDLCEIGCKQPGPHFPSMAQEALADLDERDANTDYAPLGDSEETPFTVERPKRSWGFTQLGQSSSGLARFTPVEFTEFRDTRVEVTDPVFRLVDRVNNPTFEDTVDAVLAEVRDLIIERQRTYGPDNIRQQGLLGVVNRIANDKLARIKQRLNGRVVHGEILLDPVELGTVNEPGIINDFADVIGYSVCEMLDLRGEWGAPLAGDEE